MLRTLFCNRFQWHLQSCIHTNASASSPSQMLKKKLMQMKKMKKHKKQEVMVKVPESKAYLDTATVPMVLSAVAVALFMKLLMMYDDSKEQERIERRAREAPPEQGTVRMLSREEWEEIQEIRPRTPFESKIARPRARIRTGDPIHLIYVQFLWLYMGPYLQANRCIHVTVVFLVSRKFSLPSNFLPPDVLWPWMLGEAPGEQLVFLVRLCSLPPQPWAFPCEYFQILLGPFTIIEDDDVGASGFSYTVDV